MLSNVEILRAIEEGLLKIEPFEQRMLRPSGIDLRLGNKILEQRETGVIDPYDYSSMDCYNESILLDSESYILMPGAFVLGITLEKIGLSNYLGAFVDGKSTLARLGIFITQGSSVVDTGHGWPNPRPIVLEIKNNGFNPITLYHGMKIVKLIFIRLGIPASFGYDEIGKYSCGSISPKPLRRVQVGYKTS